MAVEAPGCVSGLNQETRAAAVTARANAVCCSTHSSLWWLIRIVWDLSDRFQQFVMWLTRACNNCGCAAYVCTHSITAECLFVLASLLHVDCASVLCSCPGPFLLYWLASNLDASYTRLLMLGSSRLF
jgi:hypothetical protein